VCSSDLNVGELAAPTVTALDNAQFDPCSVGNPDAASPSQALIDRCVSTGVAAADVGKIEDIVSGQINAFTGTDLTALPKPESADTTTLGIVLRPGNFGFVRNPYLSLDYYDIKVNDYIGTFGSQEVLDACYKFGQASQCSKIVRVGGTLTNDGSGVQLFTTNLAYLQAEGLELVGSFGVKAGDYGNLRFALNANYYLTQESQSDSTLDVIDCKGRYGTQCGNPMPKFRFTQRTTWDYRGFEVSALWRHLGSASIEPVQEAGTFEQFRRIDSFNYLDMSLGYNLTKKIKFSILATNVLDKDPPVVGNEAGDTRSNSGNTFPSVYDPLGRAYVFGVSAGF
jgi:outer membrane receptor protein involved in Fe transport